MVKINKKLLPANTILVGDIYIRELNTGYGGTIKDATYLTITLGPTPHKIVDSPEEFETDVTLPIKPGTPLRKFVEALATVHSQNTELFAAKSLATH